jgi:uncharacterized protein
MDEKILEFARLLRGNGIRVSPAENLESLGALRFVGLSDRVTVKDALRSTMIKRAVDVPTFDALFDLYFSGVGDAIRASAARSQDAFGEDDGGVRAALERLEDLLAAHGENLSQAAQEWLRNAETEIERRIREALEAGTKGQGARAPQEGQVAHGLAQALGLGELLRQMEAFRARLDGLGLPRRSSTSSSGTSTNGCEISRLFSRRSAGRRSTSSIFNGWRRTDYKRSARKVSITSPRTTCAGCAMR